MAVDCGELLLRGVQVAGQCGGAAAGVAEEDRGGLDGEGGIFAGVMAEATGGQRLVQVAGDLRQGLADPGGGQGQGAEDVVGDRRLVQAADGLGGGAGQGDGVVAGKPVQVDELAEVIHGRLPVPPRGLRRLRWRCCRACRP